MNVLIANRPIASLRGVGCIDDVHLLPRWSSIGLSSQTAPGAADFCIGFGTAVSLLVPGTWTQDR
jgi:hypothetical protein